MSLSAAFAENSLGRGGVAGAAVAGAGGLGAGVAAPVLPPVDGGAGAGVTAGADGAGATADAAVVAGRLGQPARKSVMRSSGATRNTRLRPCCMASRLLDELPG